VQSSARCGQQCKQCKQRKMARMPHHHPLQPPTKLPPLLRGSERCPPPHSQPTDARHWCALCVCVRMRSTQHAAGVVGTHWDDDHRLVNHAARCRSAHPHTDRRITRHETAYKKKGTAVLISTHLHSGLISAMLCYGSWATPRKGSESIELQVLC